MPAPLSLGSYQRQLLDLYALNQDELEWIADLSQGSKVLGGALRFVQAPSYTKPGQASEDLKAASWVALWLMAQNQVSCEEFFTDLMRQDRSGLGAQLLDEIPAVETEDAELVAARDQEWKSIFQSISEKERANPKRLQEIRRESGQRFELLLGFVAKEFKECARLRAIASEVIDSPLASQHQAAIGACRKKAEEKIKGFDTLITEQQTQLDQIQDNTQTQRRMAIEEELRSLSSQRLRYQGVLDTLKITDTPPTLQSLRLAELAQQSPDSPRIKPEIGLQLKGLSLQWLKVQKMERSLGFSMIRAEPADRKSLRLQVSPHFAPSVAFLFEHGLL